MTKVSKAVNKYEGEFRLPLKKVALKPVLREGGWLPKGHDGEFLFSGAVMEFCVPIDIKRNRLVRVLTAEEEAYLEDAFGADLNLNLPFKDNFFCTDKRAKVRITKVDDLMKRGYILDLSDARDYLHYKILLTNSETIAPEWEQRFNKPGYKFVLVDQDQEAIENLKKGSAKADAYKFYDTIKDSHTKMMNFLTVYGKRPLGDCSNDFLQAELLDIIDTNLYKFLAVVKDDLYAEKLFVDDAVRVGAVVKIGKTKYALPGGDIIGNTLAEAVEYFKDKRNNEVLAKVKAQIELSTTNK